MPLLTWNGSVCPSDVRTIAVVSVYNATYHSQWYTVGSQQGWDTLPTQVVKRLSEIDEDDDTTSSFDLETFNVTINFRIFLLAIRIRTLSCVSYLVSKIRIFLSLTLSFNICCVSLLAWSSSRAWVNRTLAIGICRIECRKQPVRVRSRLLCKFCSCLPRTWSGPCWKWDGQRAEAATQNFVVSMVHVKSIELSN